MALYQITVEFSRVHPRSRNWLAVFRPRKHYGYIWMCGFNLWSIICRINWFEQLPRDMR